MADKGLGTPATRAAFIDELGGVNYLILGKPKEDDTDTIFDHYTTLDALCRRYAAIH